MYGSTSPLWGRLPHKEVDPWGVDLPWGHPMAGDRPWGSHPWPIPSKMMISITFFSKISKAWKLTSIFNGKVEVWGVLEKGEVEQQWWVQERKAQKERESDSKLFEMEREWFKIIWTGERGRFKIVFFSFLILGRDISGIIYFLRYKINKK